MGNKASKRFKECLEKVPEGKLDIAAAAGAVKGFSAAKFDQTVDLVMHLGIDPRQAEQQIRGSLSLPNGIGATRKVIAFCEEQDVEAAIAAGAIEAGSDELIKKISDGWMDFDVAVAAPKMMRSVSKLGRVLGPQGKMPSPKAGTVGEDIAQIVADYAAGKVEYRNDDGGNLHVPVGKVGFDVEKLAENIQAFVDHIKRLRPSSLKGVYIKKACVSATMSPSVELEV